MSPGSAWQASIAGALLFAVALSGCNGTRPLTPRAEREQRRVLLQNALADNPNLVDDQIELARILFDLGDGLGAETAIKAALTAGGNPATLRPLMAKAAAMQGEGERAFRILDGGDIAPQMLGEAAWVAANVHLANGNLDDARNNFDRAVQELPRESALWVDVARYRDANADAVGARDAVDFAIELDKGNGDALAFKANLVRVQAGLSAALPWYDAALTADPDNVAALVDQAATFGDLGRYRDMLTALRHAAEIAPGNPQIYYLQAVLAARADNFQLARSLLQRTRGQLDEQPSFLLLSAIVELELGGEAVAATLSDRLLDMQPQNFTARRILAVANWASGDSDGAAEALAPLVNRGDADSWSLILAARVADERDRPMESADYLGRAASLTRDEAEPFPVDDRFGQSSANADDDPLNPGVVIPAIRAEIASGNADRALRRAERIRDSNRGVADAHILVGDAAMAAGQYSLAVQAFRAARDLDASERTTVRLANALFRSGDAAGSGATILALRDSQPSSIAADRLAGHLAMDLEHWDDAIGHFERVRRRIGNRDVVILRELARAWVAKGRDDRAGPLIALAYRLQPLNRDIMDIYADMLVRRGNKQGALDLRDKAAQIGR